MTVEDDDQLEQRKQVLEDRASMRLVADARETLWSDFHLTMEQFDVKYFQPLVFRTPCATEEEREAMTTGDAAKKVTLETSAERLSVARADYIQLANGMAAESIISKLSLFARRLGLGLCDENEEKVRKEASEKEAEYEKARMRVRVLEQVMETAGIPLASGDYQGK